jgi:hypothetical protein
MMYGDAPDGHYTMRFDEFEKRCKVPHAEYEEGQVRAYAERMALIRVFRPAHYRKVMFDRMLADMKRRAALEILRARAWASRNMLAMCVNMDKIWRILCDLD